MQTNIGRYSNQLAGVVSWRRHFTNSQTHHRSKIRRKIFFLQDQTDMGVSRKI